MNTEKKSTKQIIVNIGGMGCAGCVNTVQKALENIQGVTSATVDLESETGSIIYQPDAVSKDDFKQATEDAGYEFRGIK